MFWHGPLAMYLGPFIYELLKRNLDLTFQLIIVGGCYAARVGLMLSQRGGTGPSSAVTLQLLAKHLFAWGPLQFLTWCVSS